MKWLMWKDYRLNWLIVIMALVIVVVPHLIAVIVTCYAKIYNFHDGTAYFSNNLFLSAIPSLMMSPFVFAFLGGNAIACERSERSAEFLVYLPISRRKILASKILVALLIGAFIWIVNLSIIGLCFFSFPPQEAMDKAQHFGIFLGGFLIANLTFFCVAWLFSSFMQSPAISTGIGIFTVWGLSYTCFLIAYFFGVDKNISLIWPFGLAIAFSMVFFLGGTWYYLRRVEP
jgi:ABC-type transport system involved in multi-copper enzyme maturation permease subunit